MQISSIIKKVIMSLTGLALVGFLIAHLAGNFYLYKGDRAFNGYSDMLEHNPLLIPAEIALFLTFVIHVLSAVVLTLQNRAARKLGYAQRETAGESTLSSRTMMISGLIVFAFIVLHIWQFKFGDKTVPGGLWGVVVAEFQKPVILIIYVVAMIVLGFHIAHGISSAFQSLGLFSVHRHQLRKIGQVLGWILALGFAALPVWTFTTKPTLPAIETKPADQKMPP